MTLYVLDTDHLSLQQRGQAKQLFHNLLQQKLRIGTQDLRIAAVVLSLSATLITRNWNHFGQVSGLNLEDWTK